MKLSLKIVVFVPDEKHGVDNIPADEEEFELPEWLAELPDDLEVGMALLSYSARERGVNKGRNCSCGRICGNPRV